MITPTADIKVWLYTGVADMRCSYNGLLALTKTRLHENPSDGQLFVFINRQRNQMKCLYYESGGYCLWCKRLEQGRFAQIQSDDGKILMTKIELEMLIDGIDLSAVKKRKRYHKTVN